MGVGRGGGGGVDDMYGGSRPALDYLKDIAVSISD